MQIRRKITNILQLMQIKEKNLHSLTQTVHKAQLLCSF